MEVRNTSTSTSHFLKNNLQKPVTIRTKRDTAQQRSAGLFHTTSPDPLEMDALPLAGSSRVSVPHTLTPPPSQKVQTKSRHDIKKSPITLENAPRAKQTSLLEQEKAMGLPYYNPFHNTYRPAAQLPSGLPDFINRRNPRNKNDPWHKVLFKEMITEGTKDEPKAPSIEIVNHVDDEPCPPFEFYWSNSMFYGEGVPRQDRNLKGCECIGKCDPTSQACACVQRQEFYYQEFNVEETGFVYDEHRILKYHFVPVYECNAACGCPPECSNRVRVTYSTSLWPRLIYVIGCAKWQTVQA
jgi:hypothetical protein